MRKLIVLLALLVSGTATYAQLSEDKVPVGECSLEELREDVFSTCFEREYKKYNINEYLVSTFIFYSQGKEIGRIIETPEQSFEEDLFEKLDQLE